jgi:DNA-directed RNA polymerase subunit RPC12/RpoP
MSSLVKFKYYQNSIEANRDKQILADNGIISFIANEQTIQSDWLLSNALGGIQLQVFDNDKEKATEVLKDFLENEHVELEVEHTISNPDFDLVCPKCGSNHLYRNDNPGKLFGFAMPLLSFGSTKNTETYNCYYCGNQFEVESK